MIQLFWQVIISLVQIWRQGMRYPFRAAAIMKMLSPVSTSL